jgi:CheY-like chemotaxis protein
LSKILLVTPHQSHFSGILATIEASGAQVIWAASGAEALEQVRLQSVDLVLADEALGDMTGLALVEKIVAINALINCALVSSLSEKAYHDASEGLGILMRMPPSSQKEDGERLMAHFNQILGFTK